MTANQGSTLDIACLTVVEIVTDYLEGMLDPQTLAAFEEHLRQCPGCDIFVDQIRELIRELGQLNIESLPEDAKRDIVAAFRGFTGPAVSS
jgi:predicted anti-sigma-YlaC factor YlaD